MLTGGGWRKGEGENGENLFTKKKKMCVNGTPPSLNFTNAAHRHIRARTHTHTHMHERRHWNVCVCNICAKHTPQNTHTFVYILYLHYSPATLFSHRLPNALLSLPRPLHLHVKRFSNAIASSPSLSPSFPLLFFGLVHFLSYAFFPEWNHYKIPIYHLLLNQEKKFSLTYTHARMHTHNTRTHTSTTRTYTKYKLFNIIFLLKKTECEIFFPLFLFCFGFFATLFSFKKAC